MTEYASLLEDAIKIRMNSGATTYSLLSGGLDSSAICALAARHGSLETFSIVTQTTCLEDTTSFCNRMSQDLNFKNSQFLIPYHELCFNAPLWKQRVWRAESPVNHTDSLTKTMLHYAIRSKYPEVKYLFTGTGSDQMNGGLVKWIVNASPSKEETWENFYNEILDAESKTFINRDEDALWYMRGYVNRDALATMAGKPVEQNPWMIYVDMELHAQAFSLLWDEQRASATHGHTTLYPFLDFRIAEFIAAVPPHLYRALFYDKMILREPAKKFVPEYISNHAKAPPHIPEYDFRFRLFEFLTADHDDSIFREAFGDIDTPHPVIDKKALYNKILEMREKPVLMEWLQIMHIIHLGLLEKLGEQEEGDLAYEEKIGIPELLAFDDAEATRKYLQKRLSIYSQQEMLERPLQFCEECSLVYDKMNDRYILTKNNQLLYEIEPEYNDWKNFLLRIDNRRSTSEILDELNIRFEHVEEFYTLSIKEEILVPKVNQRSI